MAEISIGKPYDDHYISENSWIRTFDPNVTDSEEYVWHRDKETRIVEILDGVGWEFQFDNELPFIINKGETIYIEKMVYHRIIPSNNQLRIKINEVI